MKIAIYGRKLKQSLSAHVEQLFSLLHKKEIEYTVYAPFGKHLNNDFKIELRGNTFTKREEVGNNVDFVFSLGGDGTMLDSFSWIGEYEIPVIGINFGRLGFLASIAIEQIDEAINVLIKNSFDIDKRKMISLTSNHAIFQKSAFALNEFTIQRSETSSMITVHTYLDGEHLNSYWADGLIVSTPTGSTGYNLSCGGPIIYPHSQSFVLTPIAPHNLNVRPMIVPDDVEIKLEVEGRSSRFLATLDSRLETIDSTCVITLKKSEFAANLVRLSKRNFINAIRYKLHWGEDLRN
ncbi:MAG: NAD kinase [Chitinophagales bacterium]